MFPEQRSQLAFLLRDSGACLSQNGLSGEKNKQNRAEQLVTTRSSQRRFGAGDSGFPTYRETLSEMLSRLIFPSVFSQVRQDS